MLMLHIHFHAQRSIAVRWGLHQTPIAPIASSRPSSLTRRGTTSHIISYKSLRRQWRDVIIALILINPQLLPWHGA
jgi:hypothetical protein